MIDDIELSQSSAVGPAAAPELRDPAPLSGVAPLSDPAPLSGAALDELAASLAEGTTIVGIGESTRSARETFDVQDQLFRRLVREHGFRALAVQDSVDTAARLDRFVTTGEGTAAAALDGAWRPMRTVETAAALEWIRDFNQEHPHDPVRIFGVQPTRARAEDYDAVLAHVRATAPDRLAEVAAHLEPIRTAHRVDEHVQRAQGIHPGRPFAEHARDALALLRSLPGAGQDERVLARMRRIVEFHEHSVAGRGSYAGEAAVWADVLGEQQRRTGLRVVYWDGIAHTSATGGTMGLSSERGPQPSTGSLLRERHGAGYASVAVGFHHGDLGVVTVPEPAGDFLDARLGAVDLPVHWLDLRRADVRRRWDGPAKLRVISGVYDPSRDAREHLAVASLADAFDVLVHVRRATPVQWLP
ncbi:MULTISPECIES: erythromycin esterase family protein [unclassified Streptomyces]|uniref:erythromycin esterase family protein n=1 Tax=unclassified Streptomyces TaxID=2593676 RepID=UPI00037A8CBF|nr:MULTISPECIES: erythromycin esterase family protein [unclassified Streptomyces]MYT33867.1 erythromycin esterase family protein [Streptomyces sp. SID8354]